MDFIVIFILIPIFVIFVWHATSTPSFKEGDVVGDWLNSRSDFHEPIFIPRYTILKVGKTNYWVYDHFRRIECEEPRTFIEYKEKKK